MSRPHACLLASPTPWLTKGRLQAPSRWSGSTSRRHVATPLRRSIANLPAHRSKKARTRHDLRAHAGPHGELGHAAVLDAVLVPSRGRVRLVAHGAGDGARRAHLD